MPKSSLIASSAAATNISGKASTSIGRRVQATIYKLRRAMSGKTSVRRLSQSHRKINRLNIRPSAIETLRRLVQHEYALENGGKSLRSVNEGAEYGSKNYWESRFARGEDISHEFEWFLGYKDVEPLMRESLDYEDRTAIFIDIGCGTSLFLRDLKKSGYGGQCIGVDFSVGAIDTMQKRPDCRDIDYKVNDARSLHHLVKGASVILDKSLMDTLLHNEDMGVASGMLKSIAQSLKSDGQLVQITQLDPRKSEDFEFLQDTVIKNLQSDHNRVKSITAHLTTRKNAVKPVPTVLFYQFERPNTTGGAHEVKIELKEYEASEDGLD